ncbi:hypothetical protein VMF7928_01286 [Vibrio marisflavi CECT 7928]|uniref:Uncharacterized protein n=2 Tax=Vibrio marisflavi TaxID=1216040 RepID=A0ABN8E0U6_9VIBR|nr:hypothetical protein VMF7928_01286 [Vibrio marisflavi CECT 7928]
MSASFLVFAVAVAIIRHERVVEQRELSSTQSTNHQTAGSVLTQTFGIESSKPFILPVPNKDTSANIGDVDLSTNMASGQYKDAEAIGTVKLDINTVLPLGVSQEQAYSAIVIVSNGSEGDSYYLCSFRYDHESEFMELIDSEWLGYDLAIDTVEANADLIHLEVTGGAVPSKSTANSHSFIVMVSEFYQLNTLKIRPHE